MQRHVQALEVNGFSRVGTAAGSRNLMDAVAPPSTHFAPPNSPFSVSFSESFGLPPPRPKDESAYKSSSYKDSFSESSTPATISMELFITRKGSIMPPKAFFSCRFDNDSKEIINYFKIIAKSSNVLPILADHVESKPLAQKVLETIKDADCTVAIITPSTISNHVTSAWINQEVGMSYAANIPVIAFVEDTIQDLGIIPIITEYITFNRNKLHLILDKALSFFSGIAAKITSKSIQCLYDNTNCKEKLDKYADMYDTRLFVNLPAKQKIAKCVVEKFISDSTKGILLDSGSVTYVIADELINSGLQIPIVTNNIAIISKMKDILHYPVHILPGELDSRTLAVGGKDTAEVARQYLMGEMNITIDIAFLAANSIDPNFGLSADATPFVDFRTAILRNARNVVVVLQGEKLLKPVLNPIVAQDEWREIFHRRSVESSMWIVCHTLVEHYGQAMENRYMKCMECFKQELPDGHVIEIC
ncbi:MAG: hypothetical protein P9M14_00795 [Candidatus Alcyoniella australis]|nr:hypothetical protein [Candidatus Alcyoniella australis]